MFKVKRKLLDECIKASVDYWASPISESEFKLTKKIHSSKVLGNTIGVDWLAIQNFIDGIVSSNGFCPYAENDEIYGALECLGWEVVDDD